MSKTTKELIITIFLAVILALTLVSSLSKVKRQKQSKKTKTAEVSEQEEKNKKDEKKEAAEKPAEKTVAKISKEELNKQRERLNMEWGSDPFFAEEQEEEIEEDVEEEKASEISELSLKGISWVSDNAVALINTQAVTEKELILGYEVIDIQKDKVILRKGDKKYELRLEE